MKRKTIQKILLATVSVFVLMIIVLSVHIYMVTRPKAPDETTRIMARIDIKQAINQQEADKIATWLYQQKGIDHVLVNPQSNIAVFTFFPVKTNANKVVDDFRSNFHLNAARYMPSEEEMKNGCPVASSSATYKIANFFKHIF